MTMDAERQEMRITMNGEEQLRFSVDVDWNEVETVHDVVGRTGTETEDGSSDITNKCVWSGEAKICVQQTVNEQYDVLLYTANVHYLAVSASREGMDVDGEWPQLDEHVL